MNLSYEHQLQSTKLAISGHLILNRSKSHLFQLDTNSTEQIQRFNLSKFNRAVTGSESIRRNHLTQELRE